MRTLRKLAAVELKLFVRDPITLIFTFAFPFFVLVILAGVFGNKIENPDDIRVWRGVGPTDYYVPAYVGLVIASIGVLALPLRLAGYRERGVLRRYHASDVPVWAILGSQLVVAVLMAVVGAVSITVVAWAAFGTFLPKDPAGVIAAFVLAVLAFTAIGVFLGAILPNARAAQAAGLILFFAMMFISGAGPPREVLSASMKAFSEVLPLTHVILLLQNPWIGDGWHISASLVTAGFLVVPGALSALLFRWE